MWFSNWGTDKGSASSCLKRALDRVLQERGQPGYALAHRWFAYPEAGTYAGAIEIEGADSQGASFVAPAVSSARTVHVLLAVTDRGAPPLARYRRVVFTVEP